MPSFTKSIPGWSINIQRCAHTDISRVFTKYTRGIDLYL